MAHFCGLCKKEVDDWGEHVKSEEHQRNINNPQKIIEAYAESQAETFALLKKIEGEEEERKKGLNND